MKAIILAAGQGQRLRPYTDDRPKCLVEYRGRPILEYALDVIFGAGIKDVIVVRGYRPEAFSQSNVRYCLNDRFATTNMVATLFSAREEMNDDLLIVYGDIIFRKEILEALLKSPDPISTTIDKEWRTLWERRMEDPLLDAETLKLDESSNIIELGKKPKSLSEIQGQYMGLIKISKDVLPSVIAFYDGLDRTAIYDGKSFDNMFMTSFIQLVIDRLMPVKGVPIFGGWIEIDAPADLALNLE